MEKLLPIKQRPGRAGKKRIELYSWFCLLYVCFMHLNRLLFLKGLTLIDAWLSGLVDVRTFGILEVLKWLTLYNELWSSLGPFWSKFSQDSKVIYLWLTFICCPVPFSPVWISFMDQFSLRGKKCTKKVITSAFNLVTWKIL